eukprot:CAMPEP_0115194908 /NCGR_PEP_ID=MMETSP0270-20121206/14310_1 /TAXON_ID=71861 /ORGANISM="Scrippsiella trochoidea, Strain CCMP3099" /LENGTH=42 /DNA_ID= /DNA_START= /DNA_END= /DNA_ORIENTATION=
MAASRSLLRARGNAADRNVATRKVSEDHRDVAENRGLLGHNH